MKPLSSKNNIKKLRVIYNMFDFSNLYDPNYDKKDSIKVTLKNREEINLVDLKKERISAFRVKHSNKIIKLPKNMTKKLAYLIGVIIGDGHIQSPLKRKKGGRYWEVRITGRHEFTKGIVHLIKELFNITPVLKKDKRKNDCWDIRIHSMIIYRFLNRIIGIKYGPKKGKTSWPNFIAENKIFFKYFLAGLIDTDGYIGKKYIALIQKDKDFLEKIKLITKNQINFKFNGPYINRKIEGIPVGWWIISQKVKDFKGLIPLKYKKPW